MFWLENKFVQNIDDNAMYILQHWKYSFRDWLPIIFTCLFVNDKEDFQMYLQALVCK